MSGRSTSKQSTASNTQIENYNLQGLYGLGSGLNNRTSYSSNTNVSLSDSGAVDMAGQAINKSLSAIENVAIDSNSVVRFAMAEQTDLMRDITEGAYSTIDETVGGAFDLVTDALFLSESSTKNAMDFANDFSRAENPDFYKYMALAGVAGAAMIAWGLKK